MARLNTQEVLLLLGLLLIVLIARNQIAQSVQSVNITATVNAVCGNDILETGEQCEGSDLGGQTCASRGYSGGDLSCNNLSCTFNTAACTISAGGSGGGGGGGASVSVNATQIILTGRAYPLSKVVILKDGQIAITTIAGPDAKFNVSLTGLSSGDYTFSVYGEDDKGMRSTLFTFPVFITQGAVTSISGIFMSPTIAVDKEEVKRGDNITIFGRSAPSSSVTIGVASEEAFVRAEADGDGTYLYNFDTAFLEAGAHTTHSKSSLHGETSSFSKMVSFRVGKKTILAEAAAEKPPSGDLNQDNRVNLVDFSITSYWYGRQNPPASVDLNSDGKINLTDFSIMAYYWTG